MSRWAAKVISRGRLLRTPPFSSAGLHLSSPALSRGGKGQEPAGASERGAQHCPFKIELSLRSDFVTVALPFVTAQGPCTALTPR